jgi:hypothetical protein
MLQVSGQSNGQTDLFMTVLMLYLLKKPATAETVFAWDVVSFYFFCPL